MPPAVTHQCKVFKLRPEQQPDVIWVMLSGDAAGTQNRQSVTTTDPIR